MDAHVMAREKGIVVVTGANGFVGTALCAMLQAQGWTVRRAVRTTQAEGDVAVGDIGPDTDWQAALAGATAIVHLAARTHVLHDHAADPMAAYRRINVEGTACLLRAAERTGVKRLVFLSSIKVNGETTAGTPYTEAMQPRPLNAYGISKAEAEDLVRASALATTILRPPLVYGPGVKANFLRLMKLVAQRVPLPLASIKNQRSLIYVNNLAHAITTSLEHPNAVGKTFLVRDTGQPSTAELIRRMGVALGVTPRLFACPSSVLALGAMLTGRSSEWQRVGSSIEMDSSEISRTMGWTPPYSLDQGLSATAQWYHREFPIKSNT